MREYPARSLALLDGLAEELGIRLFPNLRLRNATDGIIPLAAGYECASLCSCTRLKQPANYHWPTDTPENVDYGTLVRRHPPHRGGGPPPRRALALERVASKRYARWAWRSMIRPKSAPAGRVPKARPASPPRREAQNASATAWSP